LSRQKILDCQYQSAGNNGPDATGLLGPELKTIGDAFEDFNVCMLEIAFDFGPASGVDQDYVKKHGLSAAKKEGGSRHPLPI
jgi:hypothetical protein